MEKCKYCDNSYEYVGLCEDDENPLNSNTIYVCGNCLPIIKKSAHEIWTKEEFSKEDSPND